MAGHRLLHCELRAGHTWPALLSAFLLLSGIAETKADQLINNPTLVREVAVGAMVPRLKERLSWMGYSDVTLAEKDGELVGKALKGKRQANIIFDRKGQLHVEMQGAKPRSKTHQGQ